MCIDLRKITWQNEKKCTRRVKFLYHVRRIFMVIFLKILTLPYDE